MKPQNLVKDDEVIFLHTNDPNREEYYNCGTILFNFPEKRFVCIGHMEGFKYLTDNIDYSKLVAKGDEEKGKLMSFKGWTGNSILITE